MLTLIDRAINAFQSKTERGSVSDVLPFGAVYGLLAALQHGRVDGIRIEDRTRFSSLFDGKQELVNEMEIANKVLIERGLMVAGQTTAGGRGRQTVISGYMEMTDSGKRWALRLSELSGDNSVPNAVVSWDECPNCGTGHRFDVACL